MSGSRYGRLVGELASTGHLESMGLPADQVGRNDVWRVEDPEASPDGLYVKMAGRREWFERELRGIELGAELASRHDWIMAPRLLHTDADALAHVTSALPGETVAALFRRAFRVDRNPLGRRGPKREFYAALEALLRWLEAFHEVEEVPPRDGPLFDHSLPGIVDRVEWKLRRLAEAGRVEVDDGEVRTLRRLGDAGRFQGRDGRLICGDSTLGNFLWDGRRIGRIDYENIGVGSPARDYCVLQDYMDRTSRLWWYWSAGREAPAVPSPGTEEEIAVYRLDTALDLAWAAHRKGKGRLVRKSLARLREQRSRCLELAPE